MVLRPRNIFQNRFSAGKNGSSEMIDAWMQEHNVENLVTLYSTANYLFLRA